MTSLVFTQWESVTWAGPDSWLYINYGWTENEEGLRIPPADYTPWLWVQQFWAVLFPFSHLHFGIALETQAATQVSLDGDELKHLDLLQSVSVSKGIIAGLKSLGLQGNSPKWTNIPTVLFSATVSRSSLGHRQRPLSPQGQSWEPALSPWCARATYTCVYFMLYFCLEEKDIRVGKKKRRRVLEDTYYFLHFQYLTFL